MHDLESDFPLAAIQEHFWTTPDADRPDGLLTESVALRICGPLDRAALETAVTQLVKRHELLRTTLVADGPEPAMRLRPTPDAPYVTWTRIPDEECDKAAATHQILTSFVESDLDPFEQVPVRFIVISLNDQHHVLALAVHHLIADATAVGILLTELSQDYQAALDGSPSPVANPPLQYSDYVEWERVTLLPAIELPDTAFWTEILHGVSPQLDLRIDAPRPAVKSSSGKRREFRLRDSLGPEVLQFASDHRTTPYVVGLGAFAGLVTRSTGNTDFVLGVLAANRSNPQTADMIGQFSNTVPLRINVADNPTFIQIVDRCQQIISAAMDHSRLPFGRVQRLVDSPQDPSRTPLIQHLFLPKVTVGGDLAFGGTECQPLEVRRNRGRFDTIVEVEINDSGVRVWVEYDENLYSETGIGALVHDFEQLLAAWTTNRSLRVSELQLCTNWSPHAPGSSLAEAFGLTPDDTIIIHRGFSYSDEIRNAAAQIGAVVVATDSASHLADPGMVAAVPSAEFDNHVDGSSARLVIVDGAVLPAALSRLRSSGSCAIRVIDSENNTLLTADITELPKRWPRIIGCWPHPAHLCDQETPRSPFSPSPLMLGPLATKLVARQSTTGELQLVDGVELLTKEKGADANNAANSNLRGLIQALWAEHLGHPVVQPEDDFFALGGHSMSASQVIADLEQQLGITVRVRTFFEYSTPAELAVQLSDQYPYLEEFLSLIDAADDSALTTDRGSESDQPFTGADLSEVETLPLLASQRQLWLAEQANPGALTHTIPLLLRIDGPLNSNALRSALGDVVARHRGMRCTFLEIDGVPLQRIHPFNGFDVPVEDLTELSATEQQDHNDVLETETAFGSFDISNDRLLRAKLVRLRADRFVLHLLFHHLVTDEVSMTVFMRDLSKYYEARLSGSPAELPRLEVELADLVRAEQEMLAGPEGARLRQFWTRAISGASQLELPTDHHRPDQSSFRGEFLEQRGSQELANSLNGLAEQHRTTTFIAFCSAVVTVLHQLSNHTDIVLGIPTDNRKQPGARHLIGCFLNVVPVRVDLSGDPSLAEILRRVETSVIQSYEHQGLPFAEILEAVRPERTTNMHPIYQVTCELQRAGWMPVHLSNCNVTYELLSHGTARYDMSFHTLMRPEDVSIMLELNTDLWDRTTGLARIDQVIRVIKSFACSGDQRLSSIPS